jgi:hypothetical protein
VIPYRNCVVYYESVFAAESVLSVTKLSFTVETELSVANQCSLPKVCVLQQICDSLLKLSCLQRMSIHCQKCVGYNESAFAVEVVLSAVKV